jgi:hypothetical protein
MKTTTEKMEKALLRKFHTLCGKLDIGEEGKRAMVYSCGVESSRDLTAPDLMALCDRLEKTLNPGSAEMDKWRKRLIAAIGSWLKYMGRGGNNIRVIKAIACRASGKERFNDIPLERLRSLYSAFLNKGRDLQTVEQMTIDELDALAQLN